MYHAEPAPVDPRDVAMLLDPEHLIKTGYIPASLTPALRRAYRWWKRYGLVNARIAYFQVLELSSSINGWKTDRIAEVLASVRTDDEKSRSFARGREDDQLKVNHAGDGR